MPNSQGEQKEPPSDRLQDLLTLISKGCDYATDQRFVTSTGRYEMRMLFGACYPVHLGCELASTPSVFHFLRG